MNIEPVIGRYLNLDVEGASYRIYFEEAGQGIPLLCLHTAGADSRQYRHLMTDTAVTGTRTYTYDVIDNTSGTVLLSCTIDISTSFSTTACKNTNSASVTAGHYLQVKVTEGGGAPHKNHRVVFRYS